MASKPSRWPAKHPSVQDCATIHSYGRVYPRRKSIQKIPRKLPSGKRLHNYGKSPFSMGKSTISMVIFNSYVDITRGYGLKSIEKPRHHFSRFRRRPCLGEPVRHYRTPCAARSKKAFRWVSPFPSPRSKGWIPFFWKQQTLRVGGLEQFFIYKNNIYIYME